MAEGHEGIFLDYPQWSRPLELLLFSGSSLYLMDDQQTKILLGYKMSAASKPPLKFANGPLPFGRANWQSWKLINLRSLHTKAGVTTCSISAGSGSCFENASPPTRVHWI
jgi:hypothetical protein